MLTSFVLVFLAAAFTNTVYANPVSAQSSKKADDDYDLDTMAQLIKSVALRTKARALSAENKTLTAAAKPKLTGSKVQIKQSRPKTGEKNQPIISASTADNLKPNEATENTKPNEVTQDDKVKKKSATSKADTQAKPVTQTQKKNTIHLSGQQPEQTPLPEARRMARVFPLVRHEVFTKEYNAYLAEQTKKDIANKDETTNRKAGSNIEPAKLYANPLPDSELHLLFVVDADNTMTFLTEADAEVLKNALSLNGRRFFLTALDNLKAHLKNHEPELFAISEKGHEFYAYLADNVYESSALFFADELAKQVGVDNAVMFLPARHVLFLVSSDEPEAVRYVQTIAEQMYKEQDHPITSMGYRIDSGKLVPVKKAKARGIGLNYSN